MKNVKVVAAIILDNNKIFATQRGYGEFKDGWEFPGGKIEEGETPEEALVMDAQLVELCQLLIIQLSIFRWIVLYVIL